MLWQIYLCTSWVGFNDFNKLAIWKLLTIELLDSLSIGTFFDIFWRGHFFQFFVDFTILDYLTILIILSVFDDFEDMITIDSFWHILTNFENFLTINDMLTIFGKLPNVKSTSSRILTISDYSTIFWSFFNFHDFDDSKNG